MSAPGNTVHTTWEYQSLTRVSEAALVEGLNEIGREGWELVSAAQYRDVRGMLTWTALLKRPVAGQVSLPARAEAAVAPALPPPPEAAKPEEEMDFELDASAPPPPKRPLPPRSPRPAPAKPRVEISDDFDFELAETAPAAKLATRQTKGKSKEAAPEENFDFELGDTFPHKLQAAKPAPPAANPPADDDTDFDLG